MRSFEKMVILTICVFMVLGASSFASQGNTDKPKASVKQLKKELLAMMVPAEKKLITLAQAMPEGKFNWKPNDKVRTFSEVNLHVAATNYWALVYLGETLPKDIPITKEYKSTFKFEKNKNKAQVIEALKGSFMLFKKLIEKTPTDDLFKIREFFGQKATLYSFYFGFITHNHEHLGQLIAYARSCGVKPPWSK